MNYQVDITPTTPLSKYRSILEQELEAVVGEAVASIGKASMSAFEVVIFAKTGEKTYRGVFRVFEKTMQVACV